MIRFNRNGHITTYIWDSENKRHESVVITENNEGDQNFILRYLRNEVEFEDGLTLRELFSCLDHFGDIVGNMADMDYWGFSEEVKIPNMTDRGFSHLKIIGKFAIDVVPRYERTKKIEKNPKSSVLRQLGVGEPIITNEFEFENSWDILGIPKNPEVDPFSGTTIDSYSLSFIPMDEIADLEVKIEPNVELFDMSIFSNHTDDNSGILNVSNKHVLRHEEKYPCLPMAITPTLYDIIMGPIYDIGFDGTVSNRDERSDQLNEIAKNLDIEHLISLTGEDDESDDNNGDGTDIVRNE
ncbi:MAG: hypothetical protein WC284_16175 [Candidimonas sp.]